MRKSLLAKGIVVAALAVAVGGTVANAAPAAATVSGDGYHGVKLGMSVAGVKATGELGKLSADGFCDDYTSTSLPDNDRAIRVSDRNGVVELRTPGGTRTPEGIKAGSTVAQLKAKYPHAVEYRNGFSVTVPGYTDRFYDFWVEGEGPFGDNAKVEQVGLASIHYDC